MGGDPDRLSEELVYSSKEPPEKTAGRYLIRFDGVKKGNEREPDGKYVVKGPGHSGVSMYIPMERSGTDRPGTESMPIC